MTDVVIPPGAKLVAEYPPPKPEVDPIPSAVYPAVLGWLDPKRWSFKVEKEEVRDPILSKKDRVITWFKVTFKF
jgi:hypothetical protein